MSHSAPIMSSSKYKEKTIGQFFHHVIHVDLKEKMANFTPMYLFIVQKIYFRDILYQFGIKPKRFL